MEALTISDVARQAGVRTSTIRYYESIDVLPQPQRVSGRRKYDATVLERLAFIQAAQKLGFTLTEIQMLFRNREDETPLPERWQALAHQKIVEVEHLIRQAVDVRELLIQGLECGCTNLFDCMNCVVQNDSGYFGETI